MNLCTYSKNFILLMGFSVIASLMQLTNAQCKYLSRVDLWVITTGSYTIQTFYFNLCDYNVLVKSALSHYIKKPAK